MRTAVAKTDSVYSLFGGNRRRFAEPRLIARTNGSYNAYVDVLAHGLWGGALFGQKSDWYWRGAFLLGAAPDVIAFGPFLISQVGRNDVIDFPRYVHQTYNVTHSLIVWSAVTALVWLLMRKFPWVLCAWGLHVVCDIPLHEITFFPTPFLWPLHTPFVNGIRWAQLWLIFPNYVALTITYLWLRRRRQNPALSFGRITE